MAFLTRIAFMLLRGVLWAIVCGIYALVAERVLITIYKTFKRTHLGSMKTTILKPVVSLKR